jgi:carbamoyl-phosphate synthase small subunit
LQQPAILVLEDGTLFEGKAIGHLGIAVAEVVFNTAMTGYQEILSDPSYFEQIVTLTYPHIGNVGTNEQDNEADKAYAKGLVIRDLSLTASSWRSQHSLGEYLQAQKIVAIADIDTRELTRILREKGAQRACIMAGEIDVAQAKQLAKDCPSLKGMDLAKVVTCQKPYQWQQGTWVAPGQVRDAELKAKFKVVALDFGVKHNILRLLVDYGCDVTVVPATTTAEEILKHKPDGVFLSNGPGDPEPCDYAIETIQALLKTKIPMFGICLGHQLLGLALGARSYKMKFGHHGANHPVLDHRTKQVWITSQNHSFALDEKSLPKNAEVTHTSLFDQSNQGIRVIDAPAYSFQGHPEASPGPHDAVNLFAEFVQDMQTAKAINEQEEHAKAN